MILNVFLFGLFKETLIQ